MSTHAALEKEVKRTARELKRLRAERDRLHREVFGKNKRKRARVPRIKWYVSNPNKKAGLLNNILKRRADRLRSRETLHRPRFCDPHVHTINTRNVLLPAPPTAGYTTSQSGMKLCAGKMPKAARNNDFAQWAGTSVVALASEPRSSTRTRVTAMTFTEHPFSGETILT